MVTGLSFKILLFLWSLNESTAVLTTSQRHLVLSVITEARHHFDPYRTVLVSSTDLDSKMADLLLQDINKMAVWSLRVCGTGTQALETAQQHRDKIASYVIVARECDDLTRQTDELMKSEVWNSRAKFLILVSVDSPTPRLLALRILQELWGNTRALDAVVVVPHSADIHFYTWFPYQPGKHCDSVTEVTLLKKQNDKRTANGELFQDKVPKNFQGCPLRIFNTRRSDDIAPIDGILRNFNFTLVKKNGQNSFAPIHEQIRSALLRVMFGEADILYGGIPLILDIASVVDVTVPFFETKLAWYVPCGEPYSRIQRVSQIFATHLWLALCAAMFLVGVAIWCLANRSLEVRAYTNISSVLYNIWAVVLGVSVTALPRTLSLRTIMFPWICYCLAISSVFQTFFTSYLVDPGTQQQIRNIRELLDSGMQFGFRADIEHYYKGSDMKINQELLKRKGGCSSTSSCIRRIVQSRNYATIAESWLVQKLLSEARHREHVCPMNDFEIFPIYLTVCLSRGHILLDRLNRVTFSLVEAGIILQESKQQRVNGDIEVRKEDNDEMYFVFTIAHLRMVFYVLSLGYIVSFVVFLGEILCRRISIKNNASA
jgi:hypothetical protein